MNLSKIKTDSLKLIGGVRTRHDLEKARVKILGRQGQLTLLLRSLKNMSEAKRRGLGAEANKLRQDLERKITIKSLELKSQSLTESLKKEKIDVTLPGRKHLLGHLHPLTLVERQAVSIFQNLGFSVPEGPDIETEYYNFDALNIPPNHPARDLWDTFWLTPESQKLLLRTHTSPMQIRYLETHAPPLKIVVPGTVFRYEAIDQTHNIQFLQLEGLMVDKKVSVANFKAIIEDFFNQFFYTKNSREKIKSRLRPSYFPFVEPGFEVDIFYRGQWLEMMGAGMVHPKVYEAVGINPKNWQGFAFGVGLDRLAMVKYKINDIRLFYSGDIRFLKQF